MIGNDSLRVLMEKLVSRPFSIVERVRRHMVHCAVKPLQVPRAEPKSPLLILPRNACWQIVAPFRLMVEGTGLALSMKSHTPECAKIEQFAATVTPMKSYHFCL